MSLSYYSSAVETANTVYDTAAIVGIVIGSIVGLIILVGIIISIYCLCFRKPKTYPGGVMQQQQQYYGPPPSYNPAGNKI